MSLFYRMMNIWIRAKNYLLNFIVRIWMFKDIDTLLREAIDPDEYELELDQTFQLLEKKNMKKQMDEYIAWCDGN